MDPLGVGQRTETSDSGKGATRTQFDPSCRPDAQEGYFHEHGTLKGAGAVEARESLCFA